MSKKGTKEYAWLMDWKEREAKYCCDTCEKDCGVVSTIGRRVGHQGCYRPRGCILVWEEEPVFVGKMPVRKDILVVPKGTILVSDEKPERV